MHALKLYRLHEIIEEVEPSAALLEVLATRTG